MRHPTAESPERLKGTQLQGSRAVAPDLAGAGAGRERLVALGALERDALERRRHSIVTRFVTEGKPRNACRGGSQWQARPTVDEVLTAEAAVLRRACSAGGDEVTTDDVAAGAGRGVVGFGH